jgi:Uma2 family endonuclease
MRRRPDEGDHRKDADMSNAIADEPVARMSREEFRVWAEQQPGRFERINGVVVAMAPERIIHARVKARVWQALDQAIRVAGVPCEALPDGVTVEIDDDTNFEPDAIVQCGALDPNKIAADNPVVVVEVLSPSTNAIDRALKLEKYFKLLSVQHYLIVWPDKPQIVHHRRGDKGLIEGYSFIGGKITLDPPGIIIAVEDVYAR